MTDNNAHKLNIVPININEEMKNAYLDYAMSVIVSRALPDVRDGMKPVHRRVLFSMFEQNIVHNKPYRKSARVVGDVLGKYHPHGDVPVYEALVRLAQDFSMRYPLVDGQGNFGSIDGDSPAAMRYTEVRLSKISESYMANLEEDTVDFVPNYDNSEREPSVLPTLVPHLLVNGQSGIAVGMATNIPPHNLGEILDALMHLLDSPEATSEELMTYVNGPDFPTSGLICGIKGIHDAYRTGRGSIVVRGRATVETLKSGREQIIITEIPYQVNKATLIEKIADLVKAEELTGISDIRDESNKDGIRVVIEIKKGENGEVILNHLYKKTRLQDSFGVNMVCIVRGIPRLVSLKEALENFKDHRIEVITRRTNFRLRKAEERLHILDGLRIAVENIDEVIKLIRGAASPDIAKEQLMGRFNLSEKQSGAILEMRLSRLTALEQDKIVNEHRETLMTISDLKDILAKPARVITICKEEFVQLKASHADPRRTEITTDASDVNLASLIPPGDVFVTFSQAGYIKRVLVEEFRQQNRAGKGKTGAGLKDTDSIKYTMRAHTHDHLLMFSNHGKVYCFKVFELPESNATGKGKSIAQLLTLNAGEEITTMLTTKDFDDTSCIFMVTAQGTVKKTELSAFGNIRTSGLKAVNLDENDSLIATIITNGKQEVILATEKGKAIRFEESEVRTMGRSARGVSGINLDDNDKVVNATICDPNEKILSVTEFGYGKRSPLDEYRLTGRAGKGVNSIRTTERNGNVVAVISVSDNSDVMLTTNTGRVLRTPVASINVIGRLTQGVCIMRILDGEKVVSVCRPNEFDDTPVTTLVPGEEVE
jgi:DNA gyrase subunit A